MDSNDDGGISFEPPRADAPPVGDAPFLPPPMPSTPSMPSTPPVQQGWAAWPLAPPDSVPTAAVVAHGETPRRSTGKVIGGLVAVVALLGAGGFAVTRIVAGNDGGAGSPTEVGNRLIDALAAEDVLGAVDLLLPGERDVLRQPLIDVLDNLKRLGVADDAASLDKVGGLDITFDGVKVEEDPTNADDITNIHITGSSTVTVDGKAVPIGPLLIDEAFGGQRPDIDSAPQDSDVDWNLTTVKRDGRWYFSAFYSIAEAARGGQGEIPESPVIARGADTPDGAVQAVVDAVNSMDLEDLIAAMDPKEAEALQRYAPLFLDDAQHQIDGFDASIDISDVRYTVSGSGEKRTVSIDGYKVQATKGDTHITADVDQSGCTSVTVDDAVTKMCAGDATAVDSMFEQLGISDNDDIQSLVKTIKGAFSDMKPVGLTVQQVDGKWYLSPIGTYTDTWLAIMSALDKGELTDIIDGVRKVASSGVFSHLFFGDFESSSGSGDSGGDSAGGSGGDSSASGFDTCLDTNGYAEFSACVSAGLDDGSIDPSFVPPYYRFPDCGVGEEYYDGSVYSMSDDDFIAFATAAAPCFQQHVADGTIFKFELPYELSRPDCLEGRNWYTVTDSDYNQRVFDCAT